MWRAPTLFTNILLTELGYTLRRKTNSASPVSAVLGYAYICASADRPPVLAEGR